MRESGIDLTMVRLFARASFRGYRKAFENDNGDNEPHDGSSSSVIIYTADVSAALSSITLTSGMTL